MACPSNLWLLIALGVTWSYINVSLFHWNKATSRGIGFSLLTFLSGLIVVVRIHRFENSQLHWFDLKNPKVVETIEGILTYIDLASWSAVIIDQQFKTVHIMSVIALILIFAWSSA